MQLFCMNGTPKWNTACSINSNDPIIKHTLSDNWAFVSHPVAVLQFHVNEIFMETFHMENRTKTMLLTLGKKQVKRKSLFRNEL